MIEEMSVTNSGELTGNLTNKIKQLEGMNHMIAHNLRGAGANIKMLAQVLIDKKIPDECHDDADDNIFTTSEAIQYIHESSASLLNTLGTLMEVMNIQLNEKIKHDACDMVEIVEHVCSQLRGFIQQKKATITLELDHTHISYPIPYMESILYNFISNALKYSKPETPAEISISTYEKDGKVVLSVKDNGLGIDLKAHGRRIFNLYQVFHSGYESKGIGLYIIRTQIESLGGTVTVKSKVDEGSEFIVTF